MIATYSPSDAQVIVAVVTGAVALILEVLRRQTKAQRGDHARTADMVTEIRDDMRDVKADLRDVKDEVRSHGDRLRNLEHMTITQDHTDAIVANNARKLQAIQEHQNKESA